MKKIYIALIFLILFLQFAFLPNFFWEISIPNFLLITAVSIGYQKSLEENVAWFLGIGFLFEIFSSNYLSLSWFIFIFFGISVWFFQNFVINKERNFWIEIFFWFIIKIAWDVFWISSTSLVNFFQKKDNLSYNFDFFSNQYFLETFFFVLGGIVIFKLIIFLENKFNFQKNSLLR
jgi:hypothetical protein